MKVEAKMFGVKEDNTFDDIREKSIFQWLEEMEQHEDVVVRGGVKVTRDYLEDLKKKIRILEEKNELKDSYLKRMKEKTMETRYYVVDRIDGDYANLKRTDIEIDDTKIVARALLPDNIAEGSRLKYEMLQYELCEE